MTPEAQRIAIAEAVLGGYWFTNMSGVSFLRFDDDRSKDRLPEHIPDYPNDLNAMHEAEKWLFASRPGYYERSWVNHLRVVLGWSDDDGILDLRQAAETAHATAAQRAEAFLRTLGKWEDGK